VLGVLRLFPLSDPGAVFAVLFLVVLLGPLLASARGCRGSPG
jgi:hypothetical protein